MELSVHMKIPAALLTWWSGGKRNHGKVVPIILQAPGLYAMHGCSNCSNGVGS
jgi:hypothetical protein